MNISPSFSHNVYCSHTHIHTDRQTDRPTWLKWSCEVVGGGAHLTKPQHRLERDTGGVDRGEQLLGVNPIPILHPPNLALFGHKITLYSIYNTYNAQLIQA